MGRPNRQTCFGSRTTGASSRLAAVRASFSCALDTARNATSEQTFPQLHSTTVARRTCALGKKDVARGTARKRGNRSRWYRRGIRCSSDQLRHSVLSELGLPCSGFERRRTTACSLRRDIRRRCAKPPTPSRFAGFGRASQCTGRASCRGPLQRVQRQMAQESELLLDPLFFRALVQDLPGIERVSIELKRGCFRSELTQFRYDVLLEFGHPSSRPPPGRGRWTLRRAIPVRRVSGFWTVSGGARRLLRVRIEDMLREAGVRSLRRTVPLPTSVYGEGPVSAPSSLLVIINELRSSKMRNLRKRLAGLEFPSNYLRAQW